MAMLNNRIWIYIHPAILSYQPKPSCRSSPQVYPLDWTPPAAVRQSLPAKRRKSGKWPLQWSSNLSIHSCSRGVGRRDGWLKYHLEIEFNRKWYIARGVNFAELQAIMGRHRIWYYHGCLLSSTVPGNSPRMGTVSTRWRRDINTCVQSGLGLTGLSGMVGPWLWRTSMWNLPQQAWCFSMFVSQRAKLWCSRKLSQLQTSRNCLEGRFWLGDVHVKLAGCTLRSGLVQSRSRYIRTIRREAERGVSCWKEFLALGSISISNPLRQGFSYPKVECVGVFLRSQQFSLKTSQHYAQIYNKLCVVPTPAIIAHSKVHHFRWWMFCSFLIFSWAYSYHFLSEQTTCHKVNKPIYRSSIDESSISTHTTPVRFKMPHLRIPFGTFPWLWKMVYRFTYYIKCVMFHSYPKVLEGMLWYGKMFQGSCPTFF